MDERLRTVYGAAVAARFLGPAHAGTPDGEGWVSGAAGRIGVGQLVTIWLRAGPDGTPVAARFEAFADPVVIAVADWACERVAAGELGDIVGHRMIEALAVPTDHSGGALMVEDAFNGARDALDGARGRCGNEGGSAR
ncbi:MAG: hypothetical protein U5L11_11840 [Arhodomonas sp.]|nr:hypothetical protein [Arhodomonas sp.]